MLLRLTRSTPYAPNIDDTLDVFPCHGVGGLVGMVLTAVFATEGGAIRGSFALLRVHLLGLLVVVAFAGAGGYALYWLVDKVLPFRVSQGDERVGLDRSQHDESLDDGELDVSMVPPAPTA